MAKKLVAFRIDESLWDQFLRLVDESGRSAQDVLRECVKACLDARSTEVKPLPAENSGRNLSNQLRLRNTLQKLRSEMEEGDYTSAEFRFNELTNQMRRVRDSALLAEAESAATAYLQWIVRVRRARHARVGEE